MVDNLLSSTLYHSIDLASSRIEVNFVRQNKDFKPNNLQELKMQIFEAWNSLISNQENFVIYYINPSEELVPIKDNEGFKKALTFHE